MTASTLIVEVESKRQILDYFQAWLNSAHRLNATEATLVTEIARQILAKLALPFATHPDYRKAWRR
ncbi:MAG TPA: DUF6221 family protein [Amycolatopsis sp.]|nr:DUF6221 family protein [Amycolatopsis sp.]